MEVYARRGSEDCTYYSVTVEEKEGSAFFAVGVDYSLATRVGALGPFQDKRAEAAEVSFSIS